MTPRILVYDHLDKPLFELDPNRVYSLKMVEKVNGEHSLSITTTHELEKGDRIFYHDGEKLREFVVLGDVASHSDGFTHEYYCVWSLQYDLSAAYIDDVRLGDVNHQKVIGDAMALVTSTSRWEVGSSDVETVSSGWFYYTSCWDALSRVVEQWVCEVDSTITLGNPVVRRLDCWQKVGDQTPKRRFDYGYDLTSIKRTVLDDLYVCRIVPRGKGEAITDGSEVTGYGRRVTIESVNPTGEEWIQDDAAAAIVRVPNGTGYDYPTQIVIYESEETPQGLYDRAMEDLETWTRPKVSYEASVLSLSGAGMDAEGVSLGDAVQVVDTTFGEDGLRLSARVLGIEHDLLDPSNDKLTIGNFQNLMSDTIRDLEKGLSAAQEQLIDTDGKADSALDDASEANRIAVEAQTVANAVNQHFWVDTDGAHVTEVTKDEWLDTTGTKYHTGSNSLWNSLGMLFRKGLTNLLAIVTSNTGGNVTGVSIYDGQGNGSNNIVASFTNNGVVLGKDAESHAELDYQTLRLVDKEDSAFFSVSDLRDANGTASVTETLQIMLASMYYLQTSLPFVSITSCKVNGSDAAYTFLPQSNNIIVLDGDYYGYSQAEVVYTTESQYAKAYTAGLRGSGHVAPMSFAEGAGNVASGFASHAEGYECTASGISSHAEGRGCTASGYQSHAEGRDCTASGYQSHAQGIGTESSIWAQTVIGRYNAKSGSVFATGPALIIGNGSSDSSRSNALTVEWSGDVNASGRVTANGVTSSDQIRRTTDIDPSTAPSATKYHIIFRADDADGTNMGYMQAFQNTSNVDGILLNAMRMVDGSTVYNGVTFGIGATGTRSVTVSDASAWRTALGIGLSTADITPTNATATVFRVITRFICATLTITALQLTAALANNQNITIGTVPEGYRPSTTMWAAAMGASSSYRGVYISVASGGTVTLYNRTGASLPASSSVYATLTWTR